MVMTMKTSIDLSEPLIFDVLTCCEFHNDQDKRHGFASFSLKDLFHSQQSSEFNFRSECHQLKLESLNHQVTFNCKKNDESAISLLIVFQAC